MAPLKVYSLSIKLYMFFSVVEYFTFLMSLYLLVSSFEVNNISVPILIATKLRIAVSVSQFSVAHFRVCFAFNLNSSHFSVSLVTNRNEKFT